MISMTKDKQTLLILVVSVFAGGFLYFMFHHAKNNFSPRNLRTQMLSPKKRKAIPWKSKLESVASTAAVATPEATPVRETDFSNVETNALMNTVETKMKNHWRLSVDEIDKKLAMSDELISRNPDMYSLYKAKLILLLTKQNQHKLEVDESEVEELLETMASFDIVSEKALQKEAFLVARTNKRIETLMDEIDEMEGEMETVDGVDLEAQLEQKIEEKLIEMENLENQLEEGLLAEKDFLNEDVVEIPMYRSLANGDYDDVIDQAESLLDEYPDSISGHFFKIRALRLSGANDEVQDYISNLKLSEADIKELEDRINLNGENDPKDFWKRLRFQ